MKKQRYLMIVLLMVLCVVTVISLSSCLTDMDIGNNTKLGEQFMDHLIDNNRDDAYDLLKDHVSTSDFISFWGTIQPVTNDAASYEMEQIGWNINTTNGVTTYTTAYEVKLDNGKEVFLRVITYKDTEGIAGLYFSDVTEFVARTDSYVPTVNVILIIISLLVLAFGIWMFVDCLRRRIKLKVLWAILIFVGVAFTVTSGETSGFEFTIGFMANTNSMVADPSIQSTILGFTVPVGAIVYFFMRKRITIAPPTEEIMGIEEPATADGEGAEDKPSADGSL